MDSDFDFSEKEEESGNEEEKMEPKPKKKRWIKPVIKSKPKGILNIIIYLCYSLFFLYSQSNSKENNRYLFQ